MVIDKGHAIRIFRRSLRGQGLDDEQGPQPNEFHSQEFNNGFELRKHDGELIAFVTQDEQVIDADDYLLENPDRE